MDNPNQPTYTVQKGDTLDGIAFDLQYDAGQQVLAHQDEVNYLAEQCKDGKLQAGQEIKLPRGSSLPSDRTPR